MAKNRKTQVQELLRPYFPEDGGVVKELAQKIADIFKKKSIPPSETELHLKCKNYYIDFCERNDKECYWTFQHGLHLNLLLKKLAYSYEKRNKITPLENDIFVSFKTYMERLPEWYLNNLHLSTLNSSFDKIVNEMRTEINKSNGNMDAIRKFVNNKDE